MRLIDADALIAQMEADAEQMEDQIAIMFTYAAINDVKHTPTIEERKPGKWVGIQAYCDHMNEITVGSRFIPSGMVCGVYCNQCWERNSEKKNFCPNCGASMMEGEQS